MNTQNYNYVLDPALKNPAGGKCHPHDDFFRNDFWPLRPHLGIARQISRYFMIQSIET